MTSQWVDLFVAAFCCMLLWNLPQVRKPVGGSALFTHLRLSYHETVKGLCRRNEEIVKPNSLFASSVCAIEENVVKEWGIALCVLPGGIQAGQESKTTDCDPSPAGWRGMETVATSDKAVRRRIVIHRERCKGGRSAWDKR